MKWCTVRIPTAIRKEINNIIKEQPRLGYTNDHEFIREALREKIAKIKNEEPNKEA